MYTNLRKHYSPEENTFLMDNYKTVKIEELAAKLGRSKASIYGKVAKLIAKEKKKGNEGIGDIILGHKTRKTRKISKNKKAAPKRMMLTVDINSLTTSELLGLTIKLNELNAKYQAGAA